MGHARMRKARIALLLASWAFFLVQTSFAQQENPDSPRKVVNRIVPAYPEMAKQMNLRGTVKVEALVLPNGTVKSTRVIGGHPLLVRAAESAVSKWRWSASTRETVEPVELRFNPD